MNFTFDLNTVLEGIAIVGIVGIFRQLALLNSSVAGIKVWQKAHEKLDDERYETMAARLDSLGGP